MKQQNVFKYQKININHIMWTSFLKFKMLITRRYEASKGQEGTRVFQGMGNEVWDYSVI